MAGDHWYVVQVADVSQGPPYRSSLVLLFFLETPFSLSNNIFNRQRHYIPRGCSLRSIANTVLHALFP